MPCSACGKSGSSSARNATPFMLNSGLRKRTYNKSIKGTRIIKPRTIRKTLLFNLR